MMRGKRLEIVRIGLMRHFRVEEPLPVGWKTAAQLLEWRDRYEAATVIPSQIDLGQVAWSKCLSSDMRRAFATAQAAHAGTITQTPLLREMSLNPFRTGWLSLPVWMWHWVLRGAWLTSHPSQRSALEDFRKRIDQVAEMLDTEQDDTLVVSHAGVMMFLRKELLRRGFNGPVFRIAEHARLYVYERKKPLSQTRADGGCRP
jgi:broad specificity phosphatase PhoE